MNAAALERTTDSLFGHIAVELGLVSPERLAEATLLQARESFRRKLGEIFLDQGWIDSDQLLEVLKAQRDWKGDAPLVARSRPSQVLDLGSLESVLRGIVETGASDLHLHSGSCPKGRIDGDLKNLGEVPVPPADVSRLLGEALSEKELAALDSRGQVDFSSILPGVASFRGNAYRQQRGVDLVLRVIAAEPPTLQSLGLPLDLARVTQHHQGLVLVTGPSGSGKSSTLAALVDLINRERREHILTAEEPIEFRHEARRSLVNQREVGRHSRSYADILRAALREDPDVIALGELRDRESISLALTAAETGHLVLATLHTGGALRTVNRLIGAFPPAEQDQIRVMLSESLRAIVSQRLARRIGGGRVAALEILVVTRAVSNLIRESKTHQLESVLQLGTADGMCSLRSSLESLVSGGVITAEEAARHHVELRGEAANVEASHAAS